MTSPATDPADGEERVKRYTLGVKKMCTGYGMAEKESFVPTLNTEYEGETIRIAALCEPVVRYSDYLSQAATCQKLRERVDYLERTIDELGFPIPAALTETTEEEK